MIAVHSEQSGSFDEFSQFHYQFTFAWRKKNRQIKEVTLFLNITGTIRIWRVVSNLMQISSVLLLLDNFSWHTLVMWKSSKISSKLSLWTAGEKENSIRHLSLSSLSFHHQYLKSALPPLKISAKKYLNTIKVFAHCYFTSLFTTWKYGRLWQPFFCPLGSNKCSEWQVFVIVFIIFPPRISVTFI